MRTTNQGRVLPPIKFTPDPEVIESNEEAAWLEFDAAQRSLDPQEDKRALALALMEVA